MNVPRWGRGGSNRRGRPYISPQQGIIASTSFHNTTNVRVSRSNLVPNIPSTLFSSLTDTTNKIHGINTSEKTISDTSFDHLSFNKRGYKSVSKCNIDDTLNNSKKSKSSSIYDKLASTSGNSSNSKQKYKINNLHSRGGLSTHSYTPCSTTSNTSISESCIIVAVTEGRGAAKGEVGMAAMDLKRPHLILCQLSDTHSYIHSLTRLNYLNPVEIIIPHTFNHGVNTTELFKLISNNFPNVRFTTVQRRFFSEANGLQQIKHLSAPGYANVQLQLIHKFYALTSAAALLKYIEHVQCVIYAPHSLKIEYFGSQNSTLIDMETTIRLELVESLSESFNRRNSLLSVLNYTQTLGGLRSLRANILQPSCDKNIINNRLDCIEELLQNSEGLMPSLNKVMKQFVDVDKVLWLCMILPTQDGNKAGEAQLNHTLLLKKTVGILPNLVEVLKLAKGSWFVKIKKDLEDPKFTEIREHINRVIQDDAHVSRGVSGHFQRCFAVRPEINSLLDIARRSYSEIITDIQDKVFQLSEEYGLPLRLNSNAAKGFHIILPTGSKNRSNIDISNLPPVFLEIQNHGSTITMTTEEVILLDQQARESLNEIQTMSNVIIYGLLKELRAYMGVLYKLCEHTAELDMILSLAYVSSSENYVRPIFENYLELKNSIHPILDSVISTSPIPNDIFSSPEFNFHIITGPNMGGKSIYIKQIALLQIMAQIGCFVPARKAVFRIADSIFSRIGFNDSIESNASTYVLEMKEMQFILQTLTSTSLIIVDELCRGTSSEEGTSMAWVICERLLNSKAFTFFTTHFLYLTKLQDVYFNVVNLHTETTISKSDNDENKNNLVYKYKIIPGVTDVDRYGLALARNTNFPTCVLDMAEELSEVIALHKKPLPTEIQKEKSDILFYKAAAGLFQESRKNVNVEESLNTLIKHFKIDNPQLGESILKKKDAYVSPKIQALSSTSKNNCAMKSPCENPSNYSTSCSPISTITSLNFNSNLMTRNGNFMENTNMKSLMGQMNVISRSKRQKVNDTGFHTAPTVNQHDANKMTSNVSNFQQGENMFQLPLSNTLNKNIDYESIFCQPDLPMDCVGHGSSFVDSSSD